MEEEGDGVHPSVIFEFWLFVVIGEMRQVERYPLKKVEGHRGIDPQEIQEDHVIGRTI